MTPTPAIIAATLRLPIEARRALWEQEHEHGDWWIGYYRGPKHHYVCVLPTLVIRWPK